MAKTVDHCIDVHIALSCLFCLLGGTILAKIYICFLYLYLFMIISYILGVQLWWTQVDAVVIGGHPSLKVVENIHGATHISDALIEEGAIPIHHSHRLFLC